MKDENKQESIYHATIQLINQVGFANISMSKIAKVAGVSVATLYIYYENKEDMFKKVYIKAKKNMLLFCNVNLTSYKSIERTVKIFCNRVLNYAKENQEEFLFLEQSSNSPLIDHSVESEIAPLLKEPYQLFKRGSDLGLLKNVSPYLLISFCVFPITQLYKEECLKEAILQDIDFDVVIEMCWDAIKV